jgi:S1-C subfamily serine protease
VVIKILRKVPVLVEDKVEIREIIIGHGSGFIYNLKELPFVFTAHHVISDLKKNDSIEIFLKQKDGTWIAERNAQIFFNDPEHDISALFLSLDANNLSSVNFAKPVFTPTVLLKVGVRITYCGFPYISEKGEFIPIFQQGIIAGIDTGRFKDNKVAYIIDGMVNPGNSGGPAFISDGKDVIGIISAYIKPLLAGPRLAIIDGEETIDLLSRSAGLGLVVPINYAIDRLRSEINRLADEQKQKDARIQNQSSAAQEQQPNLKEVIASRIIRD